MIRHLGTVAANTPGPAGGARLEISEPRLAASVKPGDSVNVNGACLTVVRADAGTGILAFDVVPETLNRTTLGAAAAGDSVNLEPSLRLGDTLDGHLVYGHVDATADILAKDPEGQGYRLWLATPPELITMIVQKGYVALDGISLTVAERRESDRFAVALIPETSQRTTLGRKGPGDRVNVEADPIARYVAGLLGGR